MDYRIIDRGNILERGNVDFVEDEKVISIDFLTTNGIISVTNRDGEFEVSSNQGPLLIRPKVSNCIQIEVKK